MNIHNHQPDDFSDSDKAQYKALLGAAQLGKLGIIKSVSKETGKPVIVLVGKEDREDGNFNLYPLGILFSEDPANLIETPNGFYARNNNSDNSLTITE